MHTTIYKAAERGGGEYGWLKTRYSFSFAQWYDPRRMGFGALRVLNDDVIAPGGKFDQHGHQNFEIITIPLKGAVTHRDSLGNVGEVRAGEVQVMSAGTGIVHSEYNASLSEPLELFQIWIEPRERGVVPRYEQKTFSPARQGEWQCLVSDGSVPGTLMIHQDARIMWADLVPQVPLEYTCAYAGSGIYVMVIEGQVDVGDVALGPRDALGIVGAGKVTLSTKTHAQVLLIEVPLR